MVQRSAEKPRSGVWTTGFTVESNNLRLARGRLRVREFVWKTPLKPLGSEDKCMKWFTTRGPVKARPNQFVALTILRTAYIFSYRIVVTKSNSIALFGPNTPRR
ncbi:hypothetical protein RSOLAG1IB_04175 [Rhizoctonia solani AG-1 IB]|uniref:Uncharacterized protein n=1 Tax=Thanatephorus cucumeris (strain AG1-IB / isolate 7/3/14) TaxID=1108050 RepID=A0A0B7FSI7_THACB|nr:hypothetical protein RSOLAG1IB_04175 [Rhizoctonia solani AG-1 IB]